MVASVASRLALPYDSVDDLRIAAAEACAFLLTRAEGGRRLRVELTPRHRRAPAGHLGGRGRRHGVRGPRRPVVARDRRSGGSRGRDRGRRAIPRSSCACGPCTSERAEHPGSARRRPDDAEIDGLFERMPHEEAREAIAVHFQPFVEYFARRFAGRGELVEDLVQVGNIGLLNAIDRFDRSRGVQFSTYAAATIVGRAEATLPGQGVGHARAPSSPGARGSHQRTLPGSDPVAGPVADDPGARGAPRRQHRRHRRSHGRGAGLLDRIARHPRRERTPRLPSIPWERRIHRSSCSTNGRPSRRSSRSSRLAIAGCCTCGSSATSRRARSREDIGVSQMHVSRILTQTIERLRRAVDA